MENKVLKYIKKNKLSQREFARRIDMSQQLLHYHIKHPRAKWNPADARKIERATGGEILAYSLVFRD